MASMAIFMEKILSYVKDWVLADFNAPDSPELTFAHLDYLAALVRATIGADMMGQL
ncbi:MAG: hypothetical protein JRI95_06630 [Deltaproteobacteria bacterium]|nr:hypothetical protein [Deltaproteobacteria bacterium]